MASTISFNNLGNGQEIVLPTEISGRIVSTNQGTTKLLAVSKQVDDNALQDIFGNCNPEPGTAQNGPIDFTFELTTADCPLPDTYYMVTVYCWDDVDEAVSMASVTIRTAALATQSGTLTGGGGLGPPR